MAKREVHAAIVGLGRLGYAFLEKLIGREGQGIKIVAAAERDENAEGVKFAKDKGIRIYSEGKEVAQLGQAVDIIFDFTGSPDEKAALRIELVRTGNQNTVIAPVVVAEFIWGIMAPTEDFPEFHSEKGY